MLLDERLLEIFMDTYCLLRVLFLLCSALLNVVHEKVTQCDSKVVPQFQVIVNYVGHFIIFVLHILKFLLDCVDIIDQVLENVLKEET